ncbi:hypothetical protein [Lamprocystis purpurea]|jgi:hypothetical protein|uniref:hypothetical protein n=1 Tax=Lamprocystis purpurea TaxID=61598 RepID=UPI0003A295F8|nr:hypothetical protein [Lamprocystis purpurea]MBV5347509.1 hypothetical protein [bacterium]
MKYDEFDTILSQFRLSLPAALMRPDVYGVQVVLDGEEYVIQILVTQHRDESQLLPDEIVPATFAYKFDTQSKTIRTTTIVRDRARTSVRSGDSATWSPTGLPFGTAGWNVFFPTQNAWVCFSNHHVLVNPDNPTFGIDLFLGGVHRAQLHTFTLSENWDYALARYNTAADAEARCRLCADGTEHPYPLRLSDDIYPGEDYRTVGARTPICGSGRLLGIGDRDVDGYPGGATRTFRGQLIFEKMTDPGDSGSVIVRVHDNTVTGLFFAQNDSESIANRLYTIGMRFVGTVRLDGGVDIPMYDDTEAILPTKPIWDDGKARRFSGPSIDQHGSTAFHTELFGGLLFVGTAILQVDPSGRETWVKPVPPPVTAGAHTQAIAISRTEQPLSDKEGAVRRVTTFLCFG